MEGNVQPAIVEMSCMEVRAVNVHYLEGELRLEPYVRVDEHIKDCGHCSAIYDGVRNMVALLGSGELFKVPHGFDEHLYDALMKSDGARGTESIARFCAP